VIGPRRLVADEVQTPGEAACLPASPAHRPRTHAGARRCRLAAQTGHPDRHVGAWRPRPRGQHVPVGQQRGDLGGEASVARCRSLQQQVSQPGMQRQAGEASPVLGDASLLVERTQGRQRLVGTSPGVDRRRSSSASSSMPAPQAASSSAADVRSSVRIAGRADASRVGCSLAGHRRTHRPGAVRPARPARCSAEAREAATVTSPDIPVPRRTAAHAPGPRRPRCARPRW
jgi:hypothetical protein